MASEQRDDGGVGQMVFLPFRSAWWIAKGLMLLWFVSCAVHITYVRYNHLNGEVHMGELVDYYIGQAGSRAQWVRGIADTGYYWVFEATEAQRSFFTAPAPLAAPVGGTTGARTNLAMATKRGVWAVFKPELVVLAYGTLLFCVKLGLAVLATILATVLMMAAGIDGLVQRSIRRDCGGNESASLYHRAKHYGFRLIAPGMAVIFFCWPKAMDPAFVLVPGCTAAALLLLFQFSYYKKYF